jgi:hypothetical protein
MSTSGRWTTTTLAPKLRALEGSLFQADRACWHEGRAAGVWNVHQVQLEGSQDRRAVEGAEDSKGEIDE